MSGTTYGWLVLAFPLAGAITIGLTFKLVSARTAGWIGVGAIALAFLSAIGELLLEDFLIAFEAASLLLLLAAVGAVVLAGRRPEPEALGEPDPEGANR